tara:strand:+ start:540 stop:797 length:258 start_codon:yes stop_codon:yes gene_type:complete
MIKYEDITLIRYVEGFLEKEETEEIDLSRKTEEELNLRIQKFEKTINLLKKFGEVLNKKKKTKKSQKRPSNIIQIAEWLENRKIA